MLITRKAIKGINTNVKLDKDKKQTEQVLILTDTFMHNGCHVRWFQFGNYDHLGMLYPWHAHELICSFLVLIVWYKWNPMIQENCQSEINKKI